MRTMRLATSILLAGVIALPALAKDEKPDATKKLQEAEKVVQNAVTAPDKGIPKDLLQKAECVGVFPEVKKGAFVVGAEFGRGVFTCRRADGSMGAPAFFSVGAGSVGYQVGASETDLVLLIMNKEGVKHLLQDHFTLGGEAAVAAGPVGRASEAATDAQLHAQILTWSRSRGLFAGVSLDGTVIKPDDSRMEDFYGKPVKAKEVLIDQKMSVPKEAQSFINTTNRSTSRS
jgi:SH3 domain-containing YSC84-like protein 1